MFTADAMDHPQKPALIEARRATASLVAMRDGGNAPAGDASLVETDFARLGYSSAEVLHELLRVPMDFPIVVTFRSAGPTAGAPGPSCGVNSVQHRPGSLAEFNAKVRRMRNTGGHMYLSLGV